MGIPSIFIYHADNQRAVAAGLDEAKAATNLGFWADVSTQQLANTMSNLLKDRVRRETMSVHGRALVDGLGARRVVEALKVSEADHGRN